MSAPGLLVTIPLDSIPIKDKRSTCVGERFMSAFFQTPSLPNPVRQTLRRGTVGELNHQLNMLSHHEEARTLISATNR
jgi:hypothetical protein